MAEYKLSYTASEIDAKLRRVDNIKDGEDGADGRDGNDGVSCTHSWNGTTLTVTSASGTSSADLKGDNGDDYILTDADKQEIAEQAAGLVEIPAGGGFVTSDTAPTDTSVLWVDPNDDSDDGFQEAVSDALAQAKASGEFDGKDGYTPQKGIDYFDGVDGKDGQNGKDGVNGADGYTPVKGKDYFDGQDGKDGVDGKDGKTPVVGTDYFTATDKAEMVEDVLEAMEGIPSYWQTALDNGVNAINVAIETAGRNKSAFLFYTDAHWGYGSGMSPALLKYLGKHTAINKTVFGGDFGNTYESPDTGKTMDDWMDVMRSWKLAVRDIPNHHSVVGNHDQDVDAISNNKALYGFLFAPEETNDIVRGGDFYYYIDDKNEKTRYIYLNTGLGVFDDAQCDFVIDALKTLESGWHIVAVAHIWFVYDSTNTPTEGSVPVNTQKLLALFDAYNSRGSGSITISESHAYDFSACGGWVEFCIGGHTHVDYNFTSDMGIPVILCCTDSKHLRGSDYTYTAGTTTESSVSGIVADYDAKTIKIVRIGRGASHEVEMTWHEISYTNVLPIALAQDGNVYNASDTPGYKKDTRWSSSGNADQTQAGTYITGYIPLTAGDVFRLKNIVMPNATGNTCMIHLFKSLTDTSEGNVTRDNLVSSYNPVWGDDGNLAQFTIPSTSTYSYVRIQCGGIDSTSIITINEPIE